MMKHVLKLSTQDLVARYELGTPVNEFPPAAISAKKLASNVRLGVGGAWLVITTVCVGIFLLFVFLDDYSFSKLTHINIYNFFEFIGPSMFLLMPIPFSVGLWKIVQSMPGKIIVCTGGIVTIKGNKLTATPWEQITAIQVQEAKEKIQKKGIEIKAIYRIERANGSPFAIHDAIGKDIEKYYVASRVPAFVEQYESGKPLHLGKVHLSTTGITVAEQTLPWADFAEIHTAQEPPQINIFKRDVYRAWATITAKDVPSLALVQSIIEQIADKDQEKQYRLQNEGG